MVCLTPSKGPFFFLFPRKEKHKSPPSDSRRLFRSCRSPRALGPTFIRREGSPTKIDYRKKRVPTYSNLSNLQDLASGFRLSFFRLFVGERFPFKVNQPQKDAFFSMATGHLRTQKGFLFRFSVWFSMVVKQRALFFLFPEKTIDTSPPAIRFYVHWKDWARVVLIAIGQRVFRL